MSGQRRCCEKEVVVVLDVVVADVVEVVCKRKA